MKSFFSRKVVRVLLSFSVSIWMAGACLFGCTNTVTNAASEHEPATVSARHSCHSKMASNSTQTKGVPSFTPSPREMMKDCPLVVNATAATSKNSGHLPDPGRGPVSTLSLIEKKIEQSNTSLVVAYLPNRGPTHLRCCVFLI